jgi:hypothetical protein
VPDQVTALLLGMETRVGTVLDLGLGTGTEPGMGAGLGLPVSRRLRRGGTTGAG